MVVIHPEKIYSINDLDRLTGLGRKNLQRSIYRGALQAYHLDNRFYAFRGRDFLEALELNRRGEVRLSKPLVV